LHAQNAVKLLTNQPTLPAELTASIAIAIIFIELAQ